MSWRILKTTQIKIFHVIQICRKIKVGMILTISVILFKLLRMILAPNTIIILMNRLIQIKAINNKAILYKLLNKIKI